MHVMEGQEGREDGGERARSRQSLAHEIAAYAPFNDRLSYRVASQCEKHLITDDAFMQQMVRHSLQARFQISMYCKLGALARYPAWARRAGHPFLYCECDSLARTLRQRLLDRRAREHKPNASESIAVFTDTDGAEMLHDWENNLRADWRVLLWPSWEKLYRCTKLKRGRINFRAYIFQYTYGNPGLLKLMLRFGTNGLNSSMLAELKRLYPQRPPTASTYLPRIHSGGPAQMSPEEYAVSYPCSWHPGICHSPTCPSLSAAQAHICSVLCRRAH